MDCTKEYLDELKRIGMTIKNIIAESITLNHPTEPEMNFLYGVIFVGTPKNPKNHSQNICIFANGIVDRSPTCSGVNAQAAIHYARGEICVGKSIFIECITDATFSLKVHKITSLGQYNTVIPEVRGTAYITGKSSFWIDPKDPLKEGFIYR